MRQHQGQAVEAAPLDFARSDELVDEHLRAVGKVTELRFPDDEGARIVGCVAVFKAQHGFFGEDGVDDGEGGLIGRNVLQRDVGAHVELVAVLIVQHRMAMHEGAAAAVFARQAHGIAPGHERGKGHVLAHAPVHIDFAPAHGGAVFQHFFHQRVHAEFLGHGGDALGQAFPLGRRDGGVGRVSPLGVAEGVPVHGVFPLEIGQHGIDRVAAGIHGGAVGAHHVIRAVGRQHALGDELVGIKPAGAGMLGDFFVHQGLGEHGGVLLVVAQFAEADDIHHHVLVEFLAELQGQLGGQHHGFGVIAIDVQHGRFDHLDNVGAIQAGARIARIAGGKADLVVNDDVHRAAGVVATRFGQRQRFHDHALPGKGGVAMHQHGQNGVAFLVAAAIHAGAHRAFHHRVDDFQVRGVESQGQVNGAAGRGYVGAETLVVFHIAGRQVFRRGVVKLGKQHGRHLAQCVDQQIQAAAVRHADDHFLHAVLAGLLDQLVHGNDEALAAFQRKAFLAYIFGVQKALQALGGGQALQHALFLIGIELGVGAHALQFLLPPALLALIGDVHVFGADGAAIGFAQSIEQLAQRHGVLAEEGVADIEHGFHVGITETVKGRLQLGNLRTLVALERIELRPACAYVAVGGDDLLHGGALAPQIGIGAKGLHHTGAALFGALGKGVDDGQVGHIAGAAAVGSGHVLQGIKVGAPGVGHAGRVGQVVFIHLFHIGGVAAEEIGVVLIGLIDRF